MSTSREVLVKIELGPFARSGIEAISGSDDVAAGVHDALLRYADRLAWAEPIPPPRRFLDPGPESSDEVETFNLLVSAETKSALKREARRYRVTMAQILSHAVLLYLAEMDARSGMPARTPVSSLS